MRLMPQWRRVCCIPMGLLCSAPAAQRSHTEWRGTQNNWQAPGSHNIIFRDKRGKYTSTITAKKWSFILISAQNTLLMSDAAWGGATGRADVFVYVSEMQQLKTQQCFHMRATISIS